MFESDKAQKRRDRFFSELENIQSVHLKMWPGQPVPEVIRSWHDKRQSDEASNSYCVPFSLFCSTLTWAITRARSDRNARAVFALRSFVSKLFLSVPGVQVTFLCLGGGHQPVPIQEAGFVNHDILWTPLMFDAVVKKQMVRLSTIESKPWSGYSR